MYQFKISLPNLILKLNRSPSTKIILQALELVKSIVELLIKIIMHTTIIQSLTITMSQINSIIYQVLKDLMILGCIKIQEINIIQ